MDGSAPHAQIRQRRDAPDRPQDEPAAEAAALPVPDGPDGDPITARAGVDSA